MKIYFFRLFIAVDQLLNVILGPLLNILLAAPKGSFGYPDETLSSVLGKLRLAQEGNWLAVLLYKLLNKLDPNHCEDSIERDEGLPQRTDP